MHKQDTTNLFLFFSRAASLGILSLGACLGYSSPAGFQFREDEASNSSSVVRMSPLGMALSYYTTIYDEQKYDVSMQKSYYSYRTLNDSESNDKSIFNDDLTLTTSQLSWFTSSYNLGALVGGLISSPIMRYIGRRASMIASLVPSTLGWMLLGK